MDSNWGNRPPMLEQKTTEHLLTAWQNESIFFQTETKNRQKLLKKAKNVISQRQYLLCQPHRQLQHNQDLQQFQAKTCLEKCYQTCYQY